MRGGKKKGLAVEYVYLVHCDACGQRETRALPVLENPLACSSCASTQVQGCLGSTGQRRLVSKLLWNRLTRGVANCRKPAAYLALLVVAALFLGGKGPILLTVGVGVLVAFTVLVLTIWGAVEGWKWAFPDQRLRNVRGTRIYSDEQIKENLFRDWQANQEKRHNEEFMTIWERAASLPRRLVTASANALTGAIVGGILSIVPIHFLLADSWTATAMACTFAAGVGAARGWQDAD